MPDSVCSIYQEGATAILASVASPGTAYTIDTRNFRSGMVAIRNYGGEDMHTLQYTITGYANTTPTTGGIADVALADIAPNATVTYSFSNVTRAYIVVTITPKVVGDQSQYKIEYCLGL